MELIGNFIMFGMVTLFFILGICLLILPKRYFDRKKKKCNVQGVAKVVELKERLKESDRGSHTYKVYSPTYEFYYNNEEYRVNLESYGNYEVPSIDDEITININPYNPKEIYILNTTGEKILRTLALVLGIVCIFCSSFMGILTFLFREM